VTIRTLAKLIGRRWPDVYRVEIFPYRFDGAVQVRETRPDGNVWTFSSLREMREEFGVVIND
jgi:hypothetical protein